MYLPSGDQAGWNADPFSDVTLINSPLDISIEKTLLCWFLSAWPLMLLIKHSLLLSGDHDIECSLNDVS
jgi:hypothetical protein